MSTCVHILMNFVWSRCAFGPPSVIDSGRRGWTCGDLSTSKPRPFIRPAPLHKLVCDLFRPLVRFVAVISLLSFRFSFCLFLLFDCLCLSRVGFLFLTHFPRLRFKTRKRKTFVTAVPESFKLLFFFFLLLLLLLLLLLVLNYFPSFFFSCIPPLRWARWLVSRPTVEPVGPIYPRPLCNNHLVSVENHQTHWLDFITVRGHEEEKKITKSNNKIGG